MFPQLRFVEEMIMSSGLFALAKHAITKKFRDPMTLAMQMKKLMAAGAQGDQVLLSVIS